MKPIAEKPSEIEIKPIDGLDVLKNIPKTGVGKTDLDVISKMRLGGLSNDITFANLPCTFDHKNLILQTPIFQGSFTIANLFF